MGCIFLLLLLLLLLFFPKVQKVFINNWIKLSTTKYVELRNWIISENIQVLCNFPVFQLVRKVRKTTFSKFLKLLFIHKVYWSKKCINLTKFCFKDSFFTFILKLPWLGRNKFNREGIIPGIFHECLTRIKQW